MTEPLCFDDRFRAINTAQSLILMDRDFLCFRPEIDGKPLRRQKKEVIFPFLPRDGRALHGMDKPFAFF